ncbi:MAG TPA: VOC family protein [Microbacterium sp.]|nr:VOC family protein [Microbacterium sp.]
MTIYLEGITVLADDVAALADFYELALGWEVDVREEAYVAFGGQGVRVAIFSRRLMSAATDGHPAYAVQFSGQAFELNLQCDSADEVERRYDRLVAAGATPTGRPALREWGQFTGFFADPEGNIHSLFANV